MRQKLGCIFCGMAVVEGGSTGGQEFSTKENIAENPLKEKALELIQKMYEMAGKRKSVNNQEGEAQIMFIVEGMEEMAETLGILTKEEAAQTKNAYWARRKDIPQDFPDRFQS